MSPVQDKTWRSSEWDHKSQLIDSVFGEITVLQFEDDQSVFWYFQYFLNRFDVILFYTIEHDYLVEL